MAATTGTVLVVFTAAGCGGCRHIRQVLREVRRRQPDWAVYEIDAQHEAGLNSEFEVFHLPTIFLFYQGQFHCQLETEARPSAVVQATLAALHLAPGEAP